jgi:pilus assembly protein CpaE
MIRVLIADSRPAQREQLRALLAADTAIEIVGLARDGQEVLQLVYQYAPDIALLDAGLEGKDGFQTAEYLASVDLPTESILISGCDTPEQMRRAMRAGAREHLARPFAPEALLLAIHSVYADQQRRKTPGFAAAADPSRATRIIAVTGAKGGIGKTTIATNLAMALARDTTDPTLLFDFYTQFGDIAMVLNLLPPRSLADLAQVEPALIDMQLLSGFIEEHDSGLNVLLSARAPVALDTVTIPCLEKVLILLKQSYRYIVADIPPILHATTLHLLSHATTILLVANQFDIMTVHDTQRLLDTMLGKYAARDKVHVVLNRVARQNRLPLVDIERALDHPIYAQIPNDGRIVPEAINEGVPFVLSHPDSAVAQSVRQLAAQLSGRAVAKQDTLRADRPRPRWFFLHSLLARGSQNG